MFDNNQNPNPQAPNNLPFGQPQNPFVSPPPSNQPISQPPAAAAFVPAAPVAAPAQAAAAPIQDMFAETTPAAAPVSGGYPGAAPAYSQPVTGQPAYSAYNAEMFGGRSLPWGKIITAIIIILVIIGGVGAAYGGWVYFQSLSKPAATPPVTSPTATPTAPATNNQTPVVTPAVTATVSTTVPTTPPVSEVKDSDGDGLIDSEEEKYSTDKNLADTDSDGLTDWAEIKIYKSNPLNPDTDGDTYKDGQEVINGYDPLKPGSARLYETPKQ